MFFLNSPSPSTLRALPNILDGSWDLIYAIMFFLMPSTLYI